jgi:hypothetical protein
MGTLYAGVDYYLTLCPLQQTYHCGGCLMDCLILLWYALYLRPVCYYVNIQYSLSSCVRHCTMHLLIAFTVLTSIFE